MPPTIRVNTKRPKVRFNKKAPSGNDLMRPHRTCITTSTTTTTTAADIRTSQQTPSSLRLSTRRKLSATPRNRDGFMDPAGIGKTSDMMIDSAILGVDQKGNCIPELFTSLPPLQDRLETKTSRAQDRTVQDCLPLLAAIHDPSRNLFDFNVHGLPRLEREKHVIYLHNCLRELPAGFVVHDASRPWILYWVLAGLCLLGEDVQQYRTRFIALKLVQTASSWAWDANGFVL
ncbi:CAAX farnesyltransferase (FTase) subunit beta [Pseudocyphellaria aurata]|nr:CAAX farnesyltransferase (FTase) subunit beta [Pseudocyphellaria aurata]